MRPDKASEDAALKKLFKGYYGQFKLSENLKEPIVSQYRSAKSRSSMLQHFNINFLNFSTSKNSARLIIASVMIFIFVWYFHTSISKTNRIDSIVKEISTNHLKNFPFDIQLKADSDVIRYFNKQDFKPLLPDLRYSEMKLVGGRYCSIQGEAAILLTYNHQKTEKRYSLYLFKIPDWKAIKNSKKITRLVDDVEVILWSEGTLSYGLASG